MANIIVKEFTFNSFQENTFVVSDELGNAIIFDPGCYTLKEEKELFNYIESQNLAVCALFNTHCHIDHVLGNAFIHNVFAAPLQIHEADQITLDRVAEYAHVYGFEGYKLSPAPIESSYLYDQQKLQYGDLAFTVFHTPGHSPGHVVFYFEADHFVINGDVLFKGSFGRTDLPGGDLETLKRSIHEVLFQLPDDTIVYCGHGPSTTIGIEKQTNYILQF
ncbi:MAG: MBL fold metallo-hydrolase [Flavobacteriia bacterium]|jgi:glyoxylase-like metal-dependent hydrolase (beta-lactamase superfamily II)